MEGDYLWRRLIRIGWSRGRCGLFQYGRENRRRSIRFTDSGFINVRIVVIVREGGVVVLLVVDIASIID